MPDLFKSGTGRIEMSSGGHITMLATINNGDVQVDTGATAANIEVNSATSSISGTGSVGKISGVPTPAAAAVGTVNPGANGLTANTGITPQPRRRLGARRRLSSSISTIPIRR